MLAIDETNTRVRPSDIAKRIASNGGMGLVGFVGVQSNEFPRTLDLARRFRAAGIQVMIGGFHVSGCLAMLKEMQTDIKVAQELGVSIFAGEAEEGLDEVLLDAAKGELKPLYNHMKKELPGIGDVPFPPFLPVDFVNRTVGNVTSFDAGRGCPFQCSFCTIINVQGRKSRYRSPDSIEQILRMNWAQGVKRFFITDDNFARNKDWEAIYDRIIKLREVDGMDVRFMIQVDTLCHKIPNFIEKSRRAGVTRVFIGLENINPANLIAAKKRQNKITEYRKMLLEWKRVGIMTFAGYILGFPNDTPESIRHDLEIIKKELPLDALEFFVLTPLPGSEDHKILFEKNVWMDPDMNKYELEHVVTAHAKMTKRGVAGGLPLGLGHLLYRRASRDDHAARARDQHQYPLAHAGADVVLERDEDREPAPAAMGHLPRQIPQGPAPWLPHRVAAVVLCRTMPPRPRRRPRSLRGAGCI